MKKRIFALVFAITLMALSVFPARALENPAILSDLPVEEQLEYLQEQGIEVPPENVRFITVLIPRFEMDPDYPIVISNPITYELAARVRDAVNRYYQRGSRPRPEAALAARYTLQDSTVAGSWSEDFLYYNCYAYALGRTDGHYWPGKFSTVPNLSDFNLQDSIYNLACDVKADLKSASFSNRCVSMTTARPASLSSGQSCICIRRGPDDFHLMKLNSSSWYHKPGGTNPLKYKYTPSVSRNWTDEAVLRGETIAPTTYYDSTIYYFVYSKNHGSTTYTWTGNHYHSGSRHYYEYGYKCKNCGEFTSTTWKNEACSGPPCSTPWSLTPSSEIS